MAGQSRTSTAPNRHVAGIWRRPAGTPAVSRRGVGIWHRTAHLFYSGNPQGPPRCPQAGPRPSTHEMPVVHASRPLLHESVNRHESQHLAVERERQPQHLVVLGLTRPVARRTFEPHADRLEPPQTGTHRPHSPARKPSREAQPERQMDGTSQLHRGPVPGPKERPVAGPKERPQQGAKQAGDGPSERAVRTARRKRTDGPSDQ
jgi:hypothetical protein